MSIIIYVVQDWDDTLRDQLALLIFSEASWEIPVHSMEVFL